MGIWISNDQREVKSQQLPNAGHLCSAPLLAASFFQHVSLHHSREMIFDTVMCVPLQEKSHRSHMHAEMPIHSCSRLFLYSETAKCLFSVCAILSWLQNISSSGWKKK